MIYINNKLLKRNYFPAGEIKIPKDVIPKDNFYDITLRYTDDLDLFHLYLVRNCISKINPKASCQLTISYIPHARMDRENDTYFETISIIKKFIKDLDFKLISIHDPHSTVASNFQDQNVNEFYHTDELVSSVMDDIDFDKNRDYICFPDKGAHEKYQRVVDNLKDYKHIWFDKERDFASGKIIKHYISPDCKHELNKDSKVIIVDDICSYGTTFINVAKELQKNFGIENIHLVVSHLEQNARNNDDLWYSGKYIKTITATNSIIDSYWSTVHTNRIVIMKIFKEGEW